MPGGIDVAARGRDERRQQVGQVHHLLRADTRWNPARPAGESRHADSPFPERPLLAAERPVAVQGGARPLVAALERGPVVAGEDDQSVTCQIQFFEGLDQPADIARRAA